MRAFVLALLIGTRPTAARRAALPTTASSSPSTFDYDRYWQDAWANANASFAARRAQPEKRHTRWPRVFVYELAPPVSDWDANSATNDQVYGARVAFGGRLRDTNHYGMSMVLTHRLWRSSHYRTKDPAQADLFLVTAMVKPKRGMHIGSTCRENVTEKTLVAQLPHLTHETAHKHVLLMAKEHYEALACDWFSRPKGLLKRAIRLAYSQVQPREYMSDCAGQCNYCECNVSKAWANRQPLPGERDRSLFERRAYTYPHTFSVPYVSTVHWPPANPLPLTGAATSLKSQKGAAVFTSRSAPWVQAMRAVKYRMLFLGAVHGDTPVRNEIVRACTLYSKKDASICARLKYNLRKTLILKHQATFCLEPQGDSPYRRSFTDSLVLGCIPVLFSRLQDDHTYPWLWGRWREEARVLVPRQPFIDQQIDLAQLLAKAPPALVAHFQHTIEEHARVFQVSEEDDESDQLHAVLLGALRESRRLGRLYNNGGATPVPAPCVPGRSQLRSRSGTISTLFHRCASV